MCTHAHTHTRTHTPGRHRRLANEAALCTHVCARTYTNRSTSPIGEATLCDTHAHAHAHNARTHTRTHTHKHTHTHKQVDIADWRSNTLYKSGYTSDSQVWCVYICVCVCARACEHVRACVRACVRAFECPVRVGARARVPVRACVDVWEGFRSSNGPGTLYNMNNNNNNNAFFYFLGHPVVLEPWK